MTNHTPAQRGVLAATAIATTAALLGGGGAVAASAADGSVSGFTFRDFDSDGAFTAGNAIGSGIPNDVPLGGVTVRAFDRSGAQVGETTTAADGTYTLAATAAQTTQLRIEFSFSAAQQVEGYESSYHGAGSGTSVQFVTIGDTGVDFAANVPEDYSGSDPRVVVSAQRAGDPTADGYPDVTSDYVSDPELYSSVVSLAYEQSGTDLTAAQVEALAVSGDHGIATGALYGLAAPRGGDAVYAAAVLRRHTGLGEAGLGGIYLIDPTTHEATLFMDLDDGVSGGIDVGEAAFSAALGSAGSSTDNAARGLTANPGTPSWDEVAWPLIGRTGLGGLAVSPDGSTLFAVNLHARTLIVIDIATATATEVALDGLDADDRPFGVTVHHGAVYVGIVSSGETATGDAATRRAALGARVIAAPVGAVGVWTTVLDVTDLSWPRGGAANGGFGTPDWSGDDVATHWNAWTDDPGAATSAAPYDGTNIWWTDPQPILSTMTFDTNGTLVLGMLDRFSYQTGMVSYGIDTASTQHYSGIAAGGVYGASSNGDGTFTLESNGVLAGVAGAGTGNGQGPGGGQYYPSTSSAHQNSFTGAVAAAPGFGTMLSTGYDLTGGWVSDAGWMPTDGSTWSLAQRVINNSADNGSLDTTTPGAGKAGGLGGVAVLAAAAPVEIGNRTWYDADQDGVQDADEPAVPGVTVTLTDTDGNPVVDADGTAIGPVITDVNGEYFFSNLVPNRDYVVHFDHSTADVAGLTATFGITSPTQLRFTAQEETGSSTGSNPDPATGDAPVSVGGAGRNDHTIDAGFIADGAVAIAKAVTGTAAPKDAVFEITLTCSDFRGADLDPIVLSITADETIESTFPAGTACSVIESEDLGAIRTTYATHGGAATTTSVVIPLIGPIDEPTDVEIVNEFGDTPPSPTPGTLIKTGSELSVAPIVAGGLLLLLGLGLVVLTVVRRVRRSS